ncbi:uncharacterized protein LOC132639858 [Lycium barbarum]|uniref:uncharacterized protein LOC132639858 n=1 Tax=Lycium barbarum TaxID=112863 RepID=UPI00293E17E1|nr:uncharacterized protein LOC132639858 [Lycium barbarum]
MDQYEDFVASLSRIVNYFPFNGKEHQFRIFPWSIGYNPKEETSRAAVWISLPNLPPELFARRALMSIAAAVGKPIAIDKANQVRSRPSTARVKVILDLLDMHPDHVRLQYVDGKIGKVVEELQEVVYDNLPLYCNHFKHQGHDDQDIPTGKNEIIDNTDTQGDVEGQKNPAKSGASNVEAGQRTTVETSDAIGDIGTGASLVDSGQNPTVISDIEDAEIFRHHGLKYENDNATGNWTVLDHFNRSPGNPKITQQIMKNTYDALSRDDSGTTVQVALHQFPADGTRCLTDKNQQKESLQ